MPVSRFAGVCTIALSAVASACGGDAAGPPAGQTTDLVPAQVTAQLARDSLVPGEQTTVTWTVRNAAGGALPQAAVTLSSLDASRATVDSAGTVTAIAAGTPRIRVQAGAVSADVTVRVLAGGLVDAAGGTVVFGGALTLTVPAGAVSMPTAIRLTFSPAPFPDPTAVQGAVYSIGPAGVSFAVPATLTMVYQNSPGARPAGMSQAYLGMRRLIGGGWAAIAGSTVDSTTSTVTAEVNGAGTYGPGRVPPAIPCTSPESRAFDYWVGPWNVSVGGSVIAQSDITLEAGGCAVMELYRPNGGSVGRSISLYDPATDQWYQTYMDTQGFNLIVAGNLNGSGEMILRTGGSPVTWQEWSWLKVGGNVRQVAALTTDGGITFGTPFWDGLYTPR